MAEHSRSEEKLIRMVDSWSLADHSAEHEFEWLMVAVLSLLSVAELEHGGRVQAVVPAAAAEKPRVDSATKGKGASTMANGPTPSSTKQVQSDLFTTSLLSPARVSLYPGCPSGDVQRCTAKADPVP